MKTFLPGLIGILLFLVLLVLLLGLAARALARYRVTISEWQRGLLYVNGRFRAELGPGRYWTGVLGRQIHSVITARLLALVPAQEVLTADGFPVKLGAVADYRVTDPRLAHESTAGQWMESLRVAIQLSSLYVVWRSRVASKRCSPRGANWRRSCCLWCRTPPLLSVSRWTEFPYVT